MLGFWFSPTIQIDFGPVDRPSADPRRVSIRMPPPTVPPPRPFLKMVSRRGRDLKLDMRRITTRSCRRNILDILADLKSLKKLKLF
jgi:hypothetical protein